MRALAVLSIAALLSCVHPVPQPAPEQATVAATPQAVVQRAAAWLVADGFVVAAADAAGGTVTATRQGGLPALDSVIACKWPRGSGGAAVLRATVTISLAARAAPGGSAVVLAGHVRAAYPGLPLRENDDDCAVVPAFLAALRTAIG